MGYAVLGICCFAVFLTGLGVVVDIHITLCCDKCYDICNDCLDLCKPGHRRVFGREKQTMACISADEVGKVVVPVGATSNPPEQKTAFPKLPQPAHPLLHL